MVVWIYLGFRASDFEFPCAKHKGHGLAPDGVYHHNMSPYYRICFTDTFHLKRCMQAEALLYCLCGTFPSHDITIELVGVADHPFLQKTEGCSDFPPHRSLLRSD